MANGVELAPLVCEIKANLSDYNKGVDEADRKGSELEKQFKELNSEAKLTESSFKLAGASAELLGNKTGVLANKQNELSEKLKLQSRAIDLTKRAYSEAEKKLEEYSNKGKKLEEQLKDLTEEHKKAESVYGKNSNEVKKLESKINALNTEYKENEKLVNKATDEFNEYKIKLNGVQTELLQTQKALKDTNKEIKKAKISEINDKLDKVSGKLQSVGSSLTFGVTLPILAAGTASFKTASDLNENLNKTEVVFKKNAETVIEWSKTSLESMGMCQSSALEMSSKFGDMGSSMGLSSKATMEYSTNLTQLAADLASFKNISIDRANEALTGVYTGETEALKGLGIVMTQTNLQQFAENEGIHKKVQNMNQAEQVQLRYNYVMSKTKDAQGDFARTNDQAANATRTFWEATKELGATIGDDLLPMLTPLINKANETIKSFTSMDEGTRSLIIKLGLFAAATGPVLTILGKGIGLCTKLTPLIVSTGTATAGAGSAAGGAAIGFSTLGGVALPLVGILAAVAGGTYLLAKNAQVMKSSCLESKEELGFFGNALEALHGNLTLSADEMHKLNIKHKDWSEKISPETQKALTDTSNKIANLNFELEQSNGLDGVITKKQIDSLKKRTDDLFNETIEKIKQRTPEAQKAMAESFKADDGTLDKNEKKLMEFFNKSQDSQIKQVKGYQDKINQIYDKAAKEHRDVKQDEIKTIQDLTIKMGKVSLNNTAKNNQELLAAQADFNARMKNLDMKGLSSLLSEKSKARDKEIKSVRENYDKQIEELKLYRPRMNTEQQKACDDQIKKLEKLKTDAVDNEKKKYQGFLDEALKKYPELIDYIDTSNGKIMTNEEKSNYKRLTRFGEHMQGMMGITETGFYKIYNETDKKMHDCYVKVDESSGRIVSVWDKSTGLIYGNPIKAQEKIDQELKNGAKFQPIVDSYNKKKDSIWDSAIKVQCKKDWNLFDWVKDAWGGVKSWFSWNPVSPSVSKGQSRGSHYNGLDYVPYDGYVARLHKGERVITADENMKYSNRDTSKNIINFYGNYGFKDKNDIDYFMNQAAIRLKGVR